jgi:hypothetical protein
MQLHRLEFGDDMTDSKDECSEDGFCQFLLDRVVTYGEKKRGLRIATYMNSKSRKMVGSLVSYHNDGKDNGLVIDYCPFCGFCFKEVHDKGKYVGYKE